MVFEQGRRLVEMNMCSLGRHMKNIEQYGCSWTAERTDAPENE